MPGALLTQVHLHEAGAEAVHPPQQVQQPPVRNDACAQPDLCRVSLTEQQHVSMSAACAGCRPSFTRQLPNCCRAGFSLCLIQEGHMTIGPARPAGQMSFRGRRHASSGTRAHSQRGEMHPGDKRPTSPALPQAPVAGQQGLGRPTGASHLSTIGSLATVAQILTALLCL